MNQWVSGSTMVLCTVIMSMVFLVTETRVRAGEKGINDPNVKLLLILGFFFCLWGMHEYDVLDPSIRGNQTVGGAAMQDPHDTGLPLPRVCYVQEYWLRGLALFGLICGCCLGFVIFVTSRQTLSGLRHLVGRGPPPPLIPDARDRMLGKIVLFVIFELVCATILLLFAVLPIFTGSGGSRGPTCE